MGHDYDSRYQEAQEAEAEQLEGFLDDGILAVKAYTEATKVHGVFAVSSSADKMVEALRAILSILRPDDSDYRPPSRESLEAYAKKLADLDGIQIHNEVMKQFEAFMDFGIVGGVERAKAAVSVLREHVVGVCTAQVGGGYTSPPEYCDNETLPGDELCGPHREREDALVEPELPAHLAGTQNVNATWVNRERS